MLSNCEESVGVRNRKHNDLCRINLSDTVVVVFKDDDHNIKKKALTKVKATFQYFSYRISSRYWFVINFH